MCGAMASDSPVPTASTKTRSDVSMRLSALSTYGNGTVCVVAGTPVTRRLGANEPRCSQAVAEPGPPAVPAGWLGLPNRVLAVVAALVVAAFALGFVVGLIVH